MMSEQDNTGVERSHMLQTDGLKAVAAWIEVDDDRTPYVCMDLDSGRTVTVEMDGPAIAKLGKDLRDGPEVVQ